MVCKTGSLEIVNTLGHYNPRAARNSIVRNYASKHSQKPACMQATVSSVPKPSIVNYETCKRNIKQIEMEFGKPA